MEAPVWYANPDPNKKKIANRLKGNLVALHGLGNSITILNSIDAISELFDKRANNYSHRPIYTVVGELMGLDNVMWHPFFCRALLQNEPL